MTAPAAAPPKTKQTTVYVVLCNIGSEYPSSQAQFEQVGKFKATNANAAIKEAAGSTSGMYVAVPERSFRPVKVTVHTETTIRLG